uniref:Uncharacterized protein n=1 Tax=viral metagenome TaxID=1070528 RepID=A0A6C0I775_9ZZZZ
MVTYEDLIKEKYQDACYKWTGYSGKTNEIIGKFIGTEGDFYNFRIDDRSPLYSLRNWNLQNVYEATGTCKRGGTRRRKTRRQKTRRRKPF